MKERAHSIALCLSMSLVFLTIGLYFHLREIEKRLTLADVGITTPWEMRLLFYALITSCSSICALIFKKKRGEARATRIAFAHMLVLGYWHYSYVNLVAFPSLPLRVTFERVIDYWEKLPELPLQVIVVLALIAFLSWHISKEKPDIWGD